MTSRVTWALVAGHSSPQVQRRRQGVHNLALQLNSARIMRTMKQERGFLLLTLAQSSREIVLRCMTMAVGGASDTHWRASRGSAAARTLRAQGAACRRSGTWWSSTACSTTQLGRILPLLTPHAVESMTYLQGSVPCFEVTMKRLIRYNHRAADWMSSHTGCGWPTAQLVTPMACKLPSLCVTSGRAWGSGGVPGSAPRGRSRPAGRTCCRRSAWRSTGTG